MARKKSKGKGPAVRVSVNEPGRSKHKRKPAKGKHRSKGRKHNPKHTKHPRRRRRRHNPGFFARLGMLLGAGALAVGTGVGVTVLQAKIAPGNPLSLYGVPLVTLLGGAALAAKWPTVGAGVAIGALSPFTLPVASRLLGGGTTALAHTTAAVELSDAAEMGAVEISDAADEEAYAELGAVIGQTSAEQYAEDVDWGQDGYEEEWAWEG
jgi:hypothetical protein